MYAYFDVVLRSIPTVWFLLIISIQVGVVDGVPRFEDVRVSFSSMASCRYVTERLSGAVQIKQSCTQVVSL
jgi:hypothetical protein